MFSKIRKHFNIVIIFALFYVILSILLMFSEIAFHKSAYNEMVNAQSTYTNNVKNGINDVVVEGIKNISLYEKNQIINSSSSKSDVMKKTLDEINGMKLIYEVKNILLYTNQDEYYNYQNNGVIVNANSNDLKWKDGLNNSYEPKISYFCDKDSGEQYLVVSEKISTAGLVVAICYDAKDISDKVIVAEEGKYVLMNKEEVVLSNEKSYIGKNFYKIDNTYGDKKEEIDVLSNETKKMKLGRKQSYVSSMDLSTGVKFVGIVDGDKVGGNIDSFFYKNIVYMIIMFIIIVLALINSYFANQKINNIADSKYEYIDNISNELKRELITIDENVNALFNEQGKEKIDNRAKLIAQVSKLIDFKLNSVVRYAKMSKADFVNEKGEYTAVELMNEIKSIVGSEIKKNNIYLDIQIESDDRLKFYGDINQVKVAIVNLLLWSIDRTVQGGIEVLFTCDEIFANKTNFTVKVKDTSAGMDETEAAKIQENVLNKKIKINFGETGRGLESVRVVLKNLKGKFEIKSTKNVGTEVIIKIPQVALLNTDEKFLRQQRELKEKADEEQLNSSFWSGVDTKVEENGKKEDDEQLTLGEAIRDESDLISLSEMGAENNNISRVEQYMKDNPQMFKSQEENNFEQTDTPYLSESENQYMTTEDNMYTSQEESGYTTSVDNTYTSQEESGYTSEVENTYNSQNENINGHEQYDLYNESHNMGTTEGNISIDEMNKKYIEMMNSSAVSSESQDSQESPYYQTDTINSMRLNTLYVDDSINEEEDINVKKKEKMYIYLKEDSINVDDGLDASNNDIESYEKVLKEFYNYSHKNVKGIILLWNEKKVEEYYIEITKITPSALAIGANKLYNMLCKQQNNYNNQDMRALSSNVKEIFDEWKKVLLYIVEYFKN